MKKWKSKKSLRIEIAALTEENHELHRQMDDLRKENVLWEQSAVDSSYLLSSANSAINKLQEQLSKFERQRGQSGRFIKNIK